MCRTKKWLTGQGLRCGGSSYRGPDAAGALGQLKQRADSAAGPPLFPAGVGRHGLRPAYDRRVHGVIFASFGDYVAARFGPDAARRIMGEEPIYLMSEAYEDARLFELIERTGREANLPQDHVVHEFGVFAAETTFARLYPAFFAVAGSARAFMLTVEERIHELVRATIPNARPPQLKVVPLGDDGVQIAYSSPRRLCVLLRGLVEGTARQYGETATIAESACMRAGAGACLFDVRFTSAPAA